MADARNSDRPSQPRRSRLDSTIGRLVYVPAQSTQDVGQLHWSHVRDETPYFQQVSDFTQWCGPSRPPIATKSKSRKLRPWRVVRSQKNWLVKNHPEACFGDDETEALLGEEITASRAAPSAKTIPATASLLSTGEISDLRDEAHTVKGHRAVAMASGESGQLLRIVSLDKEEWTWESADVRVRLNRPNFRISGEWSHDGLPITLIKFAVDRRKYKPTRWLIVQNASSTTVFEPEINAVPSLTTGAAVSLDSSNISPNPLFTIRSGQTSDSCHSDASAFFPGGASPKLAIITQSGSWSLWDIQGRRMVRPKALKPVMIMNGRLTGGLPRAVDQGAQRILWLTVDRAAPREDGSRSPSARSELSDTEGERRPPALLMCGGAFVCLFDPRTQQLQSVVGMITSNAAQRVLDMKSSRLDPSQAFILTNTAIFWVMVREKVGGMLTLKILASCTHRKDSADPTLRLDVSPAAYLGDRKACFACVRSAKNMQMSIVWFIQPGLGMPFQHHQDVLSFPAASGFTCMEVLPVQRHVGPDAAKGHSLVAKPDLKFFEILVLGGNLDVNSALCAWLNDPHAKVTAPDVAMGSRPKKRLRKERLKFLRLMSDAFVVPDGYMDHPVKVPEDETAGEPEAPVRTVTNFSMLSSRLANQGGFQNGEAMDIDIKDVVQRLGKGAMQRRSLLDLAGKGRTTEELFQIIADWERGRLGDGLVALPIGRRQSGPRFSDFFESLQRLFIDPVKREVQGLRQEYIKRLAAEVYLAEIGIVERPASAEAAADGTADLQAALQSSFPFRSSPPLEASQEEQELSKVEEDPVSVRLRQYVKMRPIMMTGKPVDTAISSHWQLGADPNHVDFKPGKPEGTDEVSEKRRRKMERRRRRAEKLASQGLSDGFSMPAASVMGSQPPAIVASQVAEPTVLGSMGPGGSSQVVPQPMSQIVPGTYGGRPQKKAKKSGFR